MSRTYTTTERPWRPPNMSMLQTSTHLKLAHDLSEAQPVLEVDAAPANTICERGDGKFVTEGGQVYEGGGSSQACAARRCCLFMPEPEAGRATSAAAAFRRCQHSMHTAIRCGEAKGQIAGTLEGWWGSTGAFLEQLIGKRSLIAWIQFEYCVLCVVWYVLQALGEVLRCAGLLGDVPVVAHPQVPTSILAWHPHRDVFASLSPGGIVAVHSMGGIFAANTTQYLHCDRSHGYPLCFAWQPNNICGSLAVGMSLGITVWRRSQNEGWGCAWSLQGEAFQCMALTWSPDGRSLATADALGVVRIWPHGGLVPDHSTSWCVTLRRWRSGPISCLQWGPDGTVLAVAHAGRQQFVRMWDTQTWEVSLHVSLSVVASSLSPSLAWCSNETLLGAAGGQLFELSGVGASGGGWVSGLEPTARALPTPQLLPQGASEGETTQQQAVLQVAVCPRTQQRIAAVVEGIPHVLVFERSGTEGWVRQDLVLLGLVRASSSSSASAPSAPGDTASQLEGPALADIQADGSRARSIAFAGNTVHRQQGDAFEGSLLAVYWEFEQYAAEVRTYPMYFTPYKLMHSDLSVMFD